MNFDLYEVWVLTDATKADSLTKEGWTVYKGDEIKNLRFFNSSQTDGKPGAIIITNGTVIRLVGKSNTKKDHKYPARFLIMIIRME